MLLNCSYSNSEVILSFYVAVGIFAVFTNTYNSDTNACHLITSLLYIVFLIVISIIIPRFVSRPTNLFLIFVFSKNFSCNALNFWKGVEYLIQQIAQVPINKRLLFCDTPPLSFRLYWPSSGRSFTKE